MVQIADTARENAEKYGIEPAKIEETVEFSTGERAKTLTAPWGTEYTLHWGGPHLAEYTLHRGKPSDTKEYFVVVLTEEQNGQTVALSAHVIPERIPSSRDPLEFLNRLANHSDFGLDVLVWGNRRTFVSVKGEPLMQAASSEGVELDEPRPEGHEVAVENWTCQRKDGTGAVLLAFAVDATAVREDLGLG